MPKRLSFVDFLMSFLGMSRDGFLDFVFF
jgi:hypothetical protein